MKVGQSKELGKYVTAARDLKAGEVLFTEAPLVVGPVQMTQPVCLSCYTPVDGSFKYVKLLKRQITIELEKMRIFNERTL